MAAPGAPCALPKVAKRTLAPRCEEPLGVDLMQVDPSNDSAEWRTDTLETWLLPDADAVQFHRTAALKGGQVQGTGALCSNIDNTYSTRAPFLDLDLQTPFHRARLTHSHTLAVAKVTPLPDIPRPSSTSIASDLAN